MDLRIVTNLLVRILARVETRVERTLDVVHLRWMRLAVADAARHELLQLVQVLRIDVARRAAVLLAD